MKKALLCLACCLCAALAYAGNTFSFSARKAAEEQRQQRQSAEQAQAIQRLVSVPCRQRLKDRKILLLLAERAGESWNAQQDLYAPDLQLIDSRLRALGLRTFTPAEIRAQVAQAEIDAYFKGDPDAALAASKRLAASYVLRGDITTQQDVNPAAGVNEVAVDLAFTLSAADGRVLSQVAAHSDTYAGTDTSHAALMLVQKQADRLVAKLYNDYCRNADPAGPR